MSDSPAKKTREGTYPFPSSKGTNIPTCFIVLVRCFRSIHDILVIVWVNVYLLETVLFLLLEI